MVKIDQKWEKIDVKIVKMKNGLRCAKETQK